MVSIIIPAYNSEKYFRECLDSVLRQTWRDIEVIVVNDGSTDSTEEIALQYAGRDSRLKVVTVSNGGQATARNIGLDHARGEWIVFVDSDDVLYPDAVETLLRVARESGAEIVCGRFGSDAGTVAGQGSGSYRLLGQEEFIGKVLYQDEVDASVCGKLYARRLFDRQRFTDGILYEDLDISCRLAAETDRVAVCDKAVYFYRVNPASSTHRFTARRLDVLDVTARIEEYVARNYPRLLPASRDRSLSASFNMLGLILANSAEADYSEAAARCRATIRRYRRESLLNPRVRLKNKLGIIVSYLGAAFLEALLRRAYGGR